MTEALIKYGKHPKVPLGTACEGCGTAQATGSDHCHAHGWIRGLLCPACNRLMGFIDRRLTPNAEAPLIAVLLALHNRCPDCDKIGASDLGPGVPSLGPGVPLRQLRKPGAATRARRTTLLGDLLPHVEAYAKKRGIQQAHAIRRLIAEGLRVEHDGRPVDVDAYAD